MSSDELRDGDRAVLTQLRDGPKDKDTIAEAVEYAPSYVSECIESLRRTHGYDIEYRKTTKQYHLVDGPDVDDGETPEIDDTLLKTLRKGATLKDIQQLKECPRHVAQRLIQRVKERGHTVDERVPEDDGRSKVFFIPEGASDDRYVAGTGDGTYRFALIGDTHLGSSACQLDALHDFYDRLADRDISVVFHAGDITDGYDIHKGHINHLEGDAIGWGRLKEYTIENYPRRDGIDTYFIEGNHDHKYYKKNSIRYGELIARERDDLHFRGDSMVRFVFDPVNDIDLELIHPSGGQPYTTGYRLQTLYRERPVDQRPTIAGVGHLHESMYAETEGVKGFYVGGWKGLTTWGKRKGFGSFIGGWVLELEIKDGEVRRLGMDEISYSTGDYTEEFTSGDMDFG